MAKAIMAPVDLAHTEALDGALTVAADLANAQRADLTIVGVTGSGPSAAARTPAEYVEKLEAYATRLSDRFGVPVHARAVQDNDVAADLGDALIGAAAEIGADLIVMASHVPGALEHVFASNAGYVASHAKCSVYVVR